MISLATLFCLSSAVLGQVIPHITERAAPAPLAFDFTVEKKFGDLSAKEFWAQNGGRSIKRNGFAETITDVSDIYYMMNVYLGSNKQKNYVVLDTGSSDLWVPHSGYSPNTSTTSHDTGKRFGIKYIDESIAQGEYYLDTLRFETASPVLSQFQFAGSTAGGPGVLGIGNRAQEVALEKYDNLPWALQKAGIAPKASYSLYLGNSGAGTVVFGGLDTEKFDCCLTKYPIVNPGQDLAITLQSVSAGGHEAQVNSAYSIDSGTSLGFASESVMQELDVVFNTTIVVDSGVEYRMAECSQPSDQYVEFNFGDNSIAIAYSDFVMSNGDGTCVLGLAYYGGQQILGAVFLRSAYVHFDLSEQTIALAQARHSTKSNIISV